MDNLINKWKLTVENHNRKLSQLREESLGRSISKDRSVIVSNNLLSQSTLPPQYPQTEMKNQRLRNSSNESSPKIKANNKENKAPIINQSIPGSDNESLQFLLDQIVALFPEAKLKTKKQEKIRDLIMMQYQDQFKNIAKIQREIKAREAEKKEGVVINEATTRKITELEHKLQESERERHKARSERDTLLLQLQQYSREIDQKQEVHQIISVLRRSQETLEIANQKLEEMFIENKKRFKEKEDVWDNELEQLRSDMKTLEIKKGGGVN